MGRRDRKRKPARGSSIRTPKPLLLIVCEGEVTEKEYFEGFARACHNPRVHLVIHEGKGVPLTIVKHARDAKRKAVRRAKSERDDNLKYDAVWCVFDIDEHPNIPDAKQMARDNGLHVAISNPCFELWLLLHFRDQPGGQHRHRVQEMLQSYDSNYDKHVIYSIYQTGYQEAVRRARRLEENAIADGEEDRNPSTGVWRLAEDIRIN